MSAARCTSRVGWTLALASAASAQSAWQLRGAAAPVHVDAERAFTLRGPVAAQAEAGTGDHVVHFAADANGKPLSLVLSVPDGAMVALATDDAAPWPSQAAPLDGAAWREHGGEWHERSTGDDVADRRVVLGLRLRGDDEPCGLLLRRGESGDAYRCVVDPAKHEVRLERRLGGHEMVVARGRLPAWRAGEEHELAVQAIGFRLVVWLDDALVVQCFDGALTRGAFGTCHRGAGPEWTRLAVGAPVAPTAAAAAVQDGAQVALHARAPFPPGNHFLLELALDRPHPLLPLLDGDEPWLLQRSAAPLVMVADWRGSLGRGLVGELPFDGAIAANLELPALPALRHRVALARWVCVSADGDRVVGRTPSVPLRF